MHGVERLLGWHNAGQGLLLDELPGCTLARRGPGPAAFGSGNGFRLSHSHKAGKASVGRSITVVTLCWQWV